MKITLTVLSAALLISSSACDKNTDLASKSPAVETEIVQTVTEPVATINQKKSAKQQQPKQIQPSKSLAVAVESNAKISAPVAKQTTEQSLADISSHGREVTNTQVSRPRNRAQAAEDEMMMDLEKQK